MARRTAWRDTLMETTIPTGTAINQTLLGDWTTTDTRGLTVARVIVDLYLTPQLGPIATGGQVLDLGLGLASQDSFAAGDLPDPSAEADEPIRGWLWRTRCLVVDSSVTLLVARCTGDFRGMRKIDNGELYLKFDSTPAFGTAFTVEIAGIIRCLFMLP